MNKKLDGKEIATVIIIVLIGFSILFNIFFLSQLDKEKEEKDKYKRLVNIYQKDNKIDTKDKKEYVKRLNDAEEELDKVKKETNYKGYNDKSEEGKAEIDRELKESIFGKLREDEIIVKTRIEYTDKVNAPTIEVDNEGVGKVLLPIESKPENDNTNVSIVDSTDTPPVTNTTVTPPIQQPPILPDNGSNIPQNVPDGSNTTNEGGSTVPSNITPPPVVEPPIVLPPPVEDPVQPTQQEEPDNVEDSSNSEETSQPTEPEESDTSDTTSDSSEADTQEEPVSIPWTPLEPPLSMPLIPLEPATPTT